MQPQLFARTDGVLFPVPDFAAIEKYRDDGSLTALGVDVGILAVCDLTDGSLVIGDERFAVSHPGAPLRPIYYKQMSATATLTGTTVECEFVALGWQTTVNGSNVRHGVKLYPSRWVIGSDI